MAKCSPSATLRPRSLLSMVSLQTMRLTRLDAAENCIVKDDCGYLRVARCMHTRPDVWHCYSVAFASAFTYIDLRG